MWPTKAFRVWKKEEGEGRESAQRSEEAHNNAVNPHSGIQMTESRFVKPEEEKPKEHDIYAAEAAQH